MFCGLVLYLCGIPMIFLSSFFIAGREYGTA